LLIVKALVQKEVHWHLEILMEAEDAIALFLACGRNRSFNRAPQGFGLTAVAAIHKRRA
jgi:hypothetical protein